MKYKNSEMDSMIQSASPFLERRDLIGYAAARNVRVLMDAAREYLMRKEEIVREHGRPELDGDGNPTGNYTMDVEGNEDAVRELASYGDIEHEADVFKIKYEKAIDRLSGNEILSIDWMFDD